MEASKSVFEFADEDIPTLSLAVKRFYERLIAGLYNYYSDNGQIEEFIKVRKYIREYLSTEQES